MLEKNAHYEFGGLSLAVANGTGGGGGGGPMKLNADSSAPEKHIYSDLIGINATLGRKMKDKILREQKKSRNV